MRRNPLVVIVAVSSWARPQSLKWRGSPCSSNTGAKEAQQYITAGLMEHYSPEGSSALSRPSRLARSLRRGLWVEGDTWAHPQDSPPVCVSASFLLAGFGLRRCRCGEDYSGQGRSSLHFFLLHNMKYSRVNKQQLKYELWEALGCWSSVIKLPSFTLKWGNCVLL